MRGGVSTPPSPSGGDITKHQEMLECWESTSNWGDPSQAALLYSFGSQIVTLCDIFMGRSLGWLRPIVPVQSSMTAPHVAPPLCWKLPKGRSHIPAPLSSCSHPWLRPCLKKWQFGSQKSIKEVPDWDHLSCLLTGKKTTPHCLLPSLPKMSRFVTGRNSLRRKVRHFQLKFCYFLKSTITTKFPQSPPFLSKFYHF